MAHVSGHAHQDSFSDAFYVFWLDRVLVCVYGQHDEVWVVDENAMAKSSKDK